MIRRSKVSIDKQNQKDDRIRIARQKLIINQLQSIDYSLDENTCIFRVNQILQSRENFISLQLYVKPLVGLFAQIQFRPKIYFKINCYVHCVQPPRVYNDRRVFHPNINMETCQIVIPEFIHDWNPSLSYTYLLRRIKYVLIQPNPHCVPNNKFNKRAAFFYAIRRNSYRQQIMKNAPMNLDFMVNQELKFPQSLDKQFQMEQQFDFPQTQVFDVDELFAVKHKNVQQYQKQSNLQIEMALLSKQIKQINLDENIYNTSQSDCIKRFQKGMEVQTDMINSQQRIMKIYF